MPKIKLSHVISCSSEDNVHVANNLLNNDTNKKWKSKSTGEASVSVILQLEKSCKICGVDIGNENSSFIEVFVGRSTAQDNDYQILLAMSSFMTPMEARNLSNSNRVRLFTYNDLADPSRDEKWDRIKIVCTQPFNKHIQYGLSFITLHTKDEIKEDDQVATSLGKFNLRPESPDVLSAGSLFAKRKELKDNPMTISQEIKTIATPKCKEIKIKPSTTKKNQTDKEQKNRNRHNLFFDSDDEEKNDKIDKVIEKVKLEEEKKKVETPKQVKKKVLKDSDKDKKVSKDSDKDKIASKYSPLVDKPSTSTSPGTTPKRKITTNVNATRKKIKLIKKPFAELLNGVVFTISGIVNPERANIRTLALSMGAKYRSDWDNTCTHLICAFANTPKFQQVQGKGKIVTKSWIFDCSSQRKRLPWRRYALDRNDQGKPESEDEILEKINDDSDNETINLEEEIVKPSNDYLSGSDTDEEIEKILKKQKDSQEIDKQNDEPEIKTKETSQDPEFNIETDEEQLEKNPKEITEEIPKIFNLEIFFIDNVFSDSEKLTLERMIKAFNGAVVTRVSFVIDFIISKKDSVTDIKDRAPQSKIISSDWIYDCHDQLALVPYEKYLL